MTALPDIAFIGKAGAGKTSAAELLVKEFDYTRLAFADPLKDIARQLWGPGADRDREKLQRLGVAVRDIDQDTWANLLEDRWHIPTQEEGTTIPPVVVDDCRFPNETRLLAELGFVFVRVIAPTNVRRQRLQANGKWGGEASLEHISETALDDFTADYTITNDGDPQHLADQVALMLNQEARRV